jgi:uncharacterized membrane protein
MRDESEKEVIHRLEAFSDIVIGFSLAQLALSLTMPAHGRDLFVHISGARVLIALVITFALVCAIWWSHHRLFRHLFVPTRVNIFANFAALGGVIFLTYSMQVLLHVGMGDAVAYAMYTGSYGWILLLFAFIAWNGLRLRGAQLHAELHAHSVNLAVRLTVIGLWLAAMTAVTLIFGFQPRVMQWLVLALVAVMAVYRIATRSRAANSPSV